MNPGVCLSAFQVLGYLPAAVAGEISYVSQSLLSQRAEGQDDADDGHPLQHTVHSCKQRKTKAKLNNNSANWTIWIVCACVCVCVIGPFALKGAASLFKSSFSRQRMNMNEKKTRHKCRPLCAGININAVVRQPRIKWTRRFQF